jgi:hypothetical protein
MVAGCVPAERYSHSCVVVGTQLIVFGGFAVDNSGWFNDVNVLDTGIMMMMIFYPLSPLSHTHVFSP